MDERPVNDLEELRRFRDAAPGPGQAWVERTRDQLLASAEEERDAATPGHDTGPVGLLGRGLAGVRRRPAALAAAAVLAVVALAVGALTVLPGGQAPEERLAQPDGRPGASPPGAVALGRRCQAPDGSFTIRYPEGWHTGSRAGACEFFDEQPISAEAIGGGPSTAITVRTTPVTFDRAIQPGPAWRRLSSEPITVGGRKAVRELRESTGEAAAPPGMHMYAYRVDLGQRTLLAAAYDTGRGSFQHRRRVLDRMVDSLQLAADEG